jgi:hypothetical protein
MTSRYLRRWSNPLAALLLVSASQTISSNANADPGDFQAMPGLWKITMHTVTGGHVDKTIVKWRCLDDGADPWKVFVDVLVPDPTCQRAGERRMSTALAWNVSCLGKSGNGHIELDSPMHYTGDVTLNGQDALQIEAQRYAACTGPSD